MGKSLIIIIIGILSYTHLQGQSSVTISGIIRDSTGTGLSQATIRLASDRDTLHLISTSSGHFSTMLPTDRAGWNILVSMQGYRSINTSFRLPPKAKIYTLPTIILQPAYQELAAVVIHREQPLTIKTDTLEYHAGAYTMRQGSMLGDLLTKLPGFRIDLDSSVNVMGKRIEKVLVDGKEYFGADIQNTLLNLPYNIIDKVEVIDDYGDQGKLSGNRAGEPVKILNVVLKQDHRNGQFGNVQAGIGSNDMYRATGLENFLAGNRKIGIGEAFTNSNPMGQDYFKSLRLNYTDCWGHSWSGAGDGSLSDNTYIFKNSTSQDTYFGGGYTTLVQNDINNGNKQLGQLHYEWLDKNTAAAQLRVELNFSHIRSAENGQVTQSSTTVDSNFQKNSRSLSTNNSLSQNTNIESKLYFEQIFPDSRQRFSIDGGLKYATVMNASKDIITNVVQSDILSSHYLQNYQLKSSNYSVQVSSSINYYYPLHAGGFLSADYSLRQNLDHNSHNWQQPDSSGKTWQTVDSLSNTYTSQNLIHEWQIVYVNQDKQVAINFGLAGRAGALDGETPGKKAVQRYRYYNIFPVCSLTYSLHKSQEIRLGYHNNIAIPTLKQVQPVTDYSNPQYPVTGNPTLKPTISQSVRINFDKSSLSATNYHGFGIGIEYTSVCQQITADIIHPRDTGVEVQHTYFENTNGNYYITLADRVDLPFFFGNCLRISSWGRLIRYHNISIVDSSRAVSIEYVLNQNLSFQYSAKDLDLNLNVGYTYNIIRNIPAANAPITDNNIIWGFRSRYYPFINLALGLEYSQSLSWASQAGYSLSSILNMRLERSFLRKKQLTCILMGRNLTNANTMIAQTVAQNPTVIVQSRPNLLGRTFWFNIQWNFERFTSKNNKPN